MDRSRYRPRHPMLPALFFLITLIADDIHKVKTIVVLSARWHARQAVTFNDALAALRRRLWTDQIFAMSRQDCPYQNHPTPFSTG